MKKEGLIKYLFSAYIVGVVVQNLLAVKQIEIGPIIMAGGILITPIVFVMSDVITEIYGYKTARNAVLTGFAMNFIVTALFSLLILLPYPNYWQNQNSIAVVFGSTFRISCASFIAYIIGSLSNCKIMEILKCHFPNSLFVRAISSTIVGQFFDDILFNFIAFLGITPIPALINIVFFGVLIETLYEIILYPVTKKIIKVIQN